MTADSCGARRHATTCAEGRRPRDHSAVTGTTDRPGSTQRDGAPACSSWSVRRWAPPPRSSPARSRSSRRTDAPRHGARGCHRLGRHRRSRHRHVPAGHRHGAAGSPHRPVPRLCAWAAGGLIAASAVITTSFPLLLLGMLLIGMTNSATQLSRYASAEMAVPEQSRLGHRHRRLGCHGGRHPGPRAPARDGRPGGLGRPDRGRRSLRRDRARGGAAGLTLIWKLRPDPDELAVPERV